MNNHRITSMKKLRKEKRRLLAQIETEKADIVATAERAKESLWPFRIFGRFRHTAVEPTRPFYAKCRVKLL